MNILNLINSLVIAVGVPTIIMVLINLGKKLQVLETLQETNSKIKHNLTIISHFLAKKHTKFNATELQAYSPLQLTPIGNKLIENLGFSEVFLANKMEFSTLLILRSLS